MYKRYIGNTGQFVRVEDVDDQPRELPIYPVMEPDRQAEPTPPRGWTPPPAPPAWEANSPPVPVQSRVDSERGTKTPPPPPPVEGKAKLDFGAVFDMPKNLRGVLRNKMPEAIDLGDILLVLVLIYLFLEGEEDEMLIVLGILLFMWVWPLFGKDDD